MPSCDGFDAEDDQDYLEESEEELAPLKLLDEGPQLPSSADLEPRPDGLDEEEDDETRSDPSTSPQMHQETDTGESSSCLSGESGDTDKPFPMSSPDEDSTSSPAEEVPGPSTRTIPPPPPPRAFPPPPPPANKRRRRANPSSEEEDDDCQSRQDPRATTPLPHDTDPSAHPQQQVQQNRGHPPSMTRPNSVHSHMSLATDTDEDEEREDVDCNETNRGPSDPTLSADSKKQVRGRPHKKPRRADPNATQQTPTTQPQQQQAQPSGSGAQDPVNKANLAVQRPPSPHPGTKPNFSSLFRESVEAEMTSRIS